MAATTTQVLSLDFVEQQFASWRSRRLKREPIPDHLWQAAAELCATHPITHVCKRLRLSFTGLKKHLKINSCGPGVRFIELDLNGPSGAWRFECERPDGAWLRLSGNGPMPAIEHLLHHFLP